MKGGSMKGGSMKGGSANGGRRVVRPSEGCVYRCGLTKGGLIFSSLNIFHRKKIKG